MTPLTGAAQTAARRKPGDPVQRREAWFEQASEAAYRAVLAITQDRETEARSAIDELRFLKSLRFLMFLTNHPHLLFLMYPHFLMYLLTHLSLRFHLLQKSPKFLLNHLNPMSP